VTTLKPRFQWDEEKSCKKKRRFPDEASARTVGYLRCADRLGNGVNLYVYECKFCRGFHLTKIPQQPEQNVLRSNTHA
jgi:hypothetical protein